MRRVFLIIFAIFAIAAASYWFEIRLPMLEKARGPSETVQVSGESIRVIVADTPEERMKGLSGRKELPPDEGMLFIFESEQMPGFWMKDMLFPLDIIWISDDGRVAGVDSNVSTSTYPAVFYPPAPIRYVLEVNAGAAQALGIELGTHVDL